MRRHHSMVGARIAPPDLPKRRWHKLSDEQGAFVIHCIGRGMTSRETVRMFFRKFGRDIALSTVDRFRTT